MNLSMKQKQTQKHQEQTCQGGGGLVEAWIGTWDWQMKTYRMGKQQGTMFNILW